jgi:hypothetical protein
MQFVDLTNQQIFDHLLNPPAPWKPGQPYTMPDIDDDNLAQALLMLKPTKKFLETFERNLQNVVRPKNNVLAKDGKMILEKGIKTLLMEVYFDFRTVASGNKALYPHKGRVLQRFRNALFRTNFVEDPDGTCVYTAKGMLYHTIAQLPNNS